MSANRNLLYGILALQMDFVTRDQLVAAMQAWVLDKDRSLGQVLAGQGVLADEDRAALDVLVQRHLARHGHDPARSLAALPATPRLAAELNQMGDPDVCASLSGLAPSNATTAERPSPAAGRDEGSSPPGSRYRVVRLHARGGLGQVSLALEEQLGREVALKEIQERHADDADSQTRFLREAEITARLEHPGIVPVYGMDTDVLGRPRYAMRFVRGASLHEEIERFHQADAGRREPTERALALRGLLRRFLDVCDAVAYAHSRGVIRRDLKPHNVMVGEYGETLVVDWGLARVLEQAEGLTQPHRPIDTPSGSSTSPTQQGQVVGTPAFMAPEQARGEQGQVGTGTDVFALGATLYCLLTGQPPYRGKHDEVLAQACRGQVVPARQVNARVPAALEAVCRKALAARPEDRYGSARELAGEVERWLADEPVAAYREPVTVRLRRWGRRHRTVVTAGGVLLGASVVGLALGLAAVSAQKQETAHQRDLALEAKEEASTNLKRAEANLKLAREAKEEASTNLKRAEANLKLARDAVDRCFGLAREDPRLQGDGLKEVRKVLLASTLPFYKSFREQESADPALADRQADYLFRVGHISAALGRTAEAVESYEQAKDLRQALVQTHPGVPRYRADLAATWLNLGILQHDTGRTRQARQSYERGRDLFLGLTKNTPADPEHESGLARAWHSLADLLEEEGKPREALKAHEEALAIRTRLARTHPDAPLIQTLLASTLNNLGVLQYSTGQPEQGLKHLEESLKIRTRLVELHPGVVRYRADLASTLHNLGSLQRQRSNPQAALASYERARLIRRTVAALHPEVAEYRASLASTCRQLGDLQGSLRQHKEALANLEQARDLLARLSKDHPLVTEYHLQLANTWSDLAALLSKMGKPEEALKSAERARDTLLEVHKQQGQGAQNRATMAAMWNTLGNLQGEQGRWAEARASLEKARAIYRELNEANPGVTLHRVDLAGTCCNLGTLLRGSGKAEQSLLLFAEAIDLLQAVRQREPDHHDARLFLRNSHWGRARSLVVLGRHREAAADWDQTARLDEGRLKPYFRLQQALALARAGEPGQALSLVEPLAPMRDPPGEIAHDLARIYALSAQSVTRDTTRPLAERETHAERSARAALALLENAGPGGILPIASSAGRSEEGRRPGVPARAGRFPTVAVPCGGKDTMSADRNLLYGILAVQMDFVTRDQLVEAMHAWMLHREQTLAQVLFDLGMLAGPDRAALDLLVERHLARHEDDPARSLAALPGTAALAHDLDGVGDPDVCASLAVLAGTVGTPSGKPRPGGARYRVLRLHATGGVGQVSVAVDEPLNREVALKEMQQRHADDDACRTRFLREAEITARLEHPGIVPVYGLDADERGRPRYAMRFVRGESLHDAVARFHQADLSRRDPTERALALRGLLRRFLDTCDAVAYAHSRGVIHRDLKPHNIMLGDYGETLVVDWGLARVLEQDEAQTQPYRAIKPPADGSTMPTQEGQVVGTPAFMAPEQARGEQERVGTASDVFALGATLYCVLTGQPPYRGKREEVLAQACRGEVVVARRVNPRVPAALDAVCKKSLAARPADRYGSVRELAGEVERWLADEPVQAYREPLATRMRRWSRRHRTLVTAAGVLLAASVVGLALGLWAVGVEQRETARQRDEATTQLARAEANLDLAQKAVDECFGLAHDHALLQQEHVKAVKKLLLEKTLPFYERFRTQKPDDTNLADRQAEYLLRVAYITDEIDRKAEAVKSYEKARDVWLALSETHPEVPRYRSQLASAWNNLGIVQGHTGKLKEALSSYEQARRLRLALSQAHPEVRDYSFALAQSWHNLGTLQETTGNLNRALLSYEKARDIRLTLTRAPSGNRNNWGMLAHTLNNLGNLQRETGRLEEALVSLKKARDIGLALSRGHPEMGTYRADLARSWSSLGILHRETGQPREAEASYEKALDLVLVLTRAHPNVPLYRSEHAMVRSNLGHVQHEMGKTKEALANLNEARDLLLDLTHADPEVTHHRLDLARTLGGLALVQREMGKSTQARASLEKARDLLLALNAAQPVIPTYRFTLAETLSTLGMLQSEAGHRKEGLANCEQARDVLRELARAHTDVTWYQVGLAGTWCNLAVLSLTSERPRDALPLADQAIRLLETVRRRAPRHPTARLYLGNSYAARAAALYQLGRWAESVAALDQGIPLTPKAEQPPRRLGRAMALTAAKEHARALQELQHLARFDDLEPDFVYSLARLHATLAGARRAQDDTRPLPEREKWAEQAARTALELLERARRAGRFGTRQKIEALKKDEDLDFLRGRDDFRQFLSRLEADAKS
jgi:serine/threonine-protein kinase